MAIEKSAATVKISWPLMTLEAAEKQFSPLINTDATEKTNTLSGRICFVELFAAFW